ncbi:MAG: hypothetical protein HYV07_17645 [Deltaproteobacteria bacterium]|nr:hypothetical protein [Deltaproteobacteria bacterium]
MRPRKTRFLASGDGGSAAEWTRLNELAARFESMFLEIGLEPDEATRASIVTRKMLATNWPTVTRAPTQGALGSVSRLLGLLRLPFLGEANKLEVVAFARAFDLAGVPMDVALAFARVMVEAFSADDFYSPVWSALGQSGPIDWRRLASLDPSTLEPDAADPAGSETTQVSARAPTRSGPSARAATTGASAPRAASAAQPRTRAPTPKR